MKSYHSQQRLHESLLNALLGQPGLPSVASVNVSSKDLQVAFHPAEHKEEYKDVAINNTM
jgi:hypothetical protein